MSKIIQPQQQLILMLFTVGFLIIISLLLPSEVVLVEGQTFFIPQLSDFTPLSQKNYADITKIKERFQRSSKGTAKTDKKSPILDQNIQIQYPINQDTLLYSMFRALNYLDKKESLIRILHFGDSQLEGDRITAPLREKLQNEFGGCGVGLLPVIGRPPKLTIGQSNSRNWLGFNFIGNQARNLPSNFGLLGTYFNFSGQSAWFEISTYQDGKENANHGEQLKILYQNPYSPMRIQIKVDQIQSSQFQLPQEELNAMYDYNLPQGYKKIQVEIQSDNSPTIYGLAIDCKKGLAVDNIPLRGGSGLDFRKIDKTILKEQLQKLKVKCIILQFGVNLVPFLTQNFNYFQEQFYKELKYLKELGPDISVIVIGVSDMSVKYKGHYISYPNIIPIRNAQKHAAFQAGCAFWDLYEAMGGNNSMPSWVMTKPALASPDFVHFTAQGAELVAEMFYKAILFEYDKFLLKGGGTTVKKQ
jgi:lysophospholipase L1-like esterase